MGSTLRSQEHRRDAKTFGMSFPYVPLHMQATPRNRHVPRRRRCNSAHVSWDHKQTRSADEGAIVFCQCDLRPTMGHPATTCRIASAWSSESKTWRTVVRHY